MGKEKYDGYDDFLSNVARTFQDPDPDIIKFRGSGRRQSVPDDDNELELFATSEDIERERERIAKELEGKPGSRIIQAPEETVYFRRYNGELRQIRYTEAELQSFREGCRAVLVHDYAENDYYHISDEERAKNDKLAVLAMKLGGLKSLYRRVDEYIMAMRVVYEAWSILADTDPLFTRDEFFERVADGRITSPRIPKPTLKGIDKYNQDLLFQYIANPKLDPKDLLPPSDDDLYNNDYLYGESDEEWNLETMRLLDYDEIEAVRYYEKGDPNYNIPVQTVKKKYMKVYRDSLDYGIGKKKKNKFKKGEKKFAKSTIAMLKKIQGNQNRRSYLSGGVYDFGFTDIFAEREREKTVYEKIPYRGSFRNNDALWLYNLTVDTEKMSMPTKTNPHKTYGDVRWERFFRDLEESGVNTISLQRMLDEVRYPKMDPRQNQLDQKREHKQNRKVEKKIINRIIALSDNPKFKKLIKKTEEEYSRKQQEDADGVERDDSISLHDLLG